MAFGGLNLGFGLGTPKTYPPFAAETKAVFDRFSSVPAVKQQRAYDRLIRALVACGAFAICDGFYIIGADEQAWTRNLIADAYNLTAVNSPTFSANSYVVGNGSTSYYNTGANPTTMVSPKFVLDSAHVGILSLTNLANSGPALSYDIGNGNAFIARTAATSGGVTYRVNRTGSSLSISAGYPGHIVASRSAADAFKLWGNGADIGGAASASTGLHNSNIGICGAAGSLFGVNQIRAAHFGSYMDQAIAAAVNSAIRAYATEIGAA